MDVVRAKQLEVLGMQLEDALDHLSGLERDDRLEPSGLARRRLYAKVEECKTLMVSIERLLLETDI